MKKAYVFPGQGSQFPGMAKPLYEQNAKGRELLERANEILDFRITDIMFEGTPEDLKATRVTQPAIFLHSVVLAKCLPDFAPDMVAGHSLGEFSALAAADAIGFEDALQLVHIRATEMQKCCEQVPGTMAAIIGLPDTKVEEICASCNGIVIPANYNCDGQIVISGEKTAVEEACEKAKAAALSARCRCPSAEPSTPRSWSRPVSSSGKPSRLRKSSAGLSGLPERERATRDGSRGDQEEPARAIDLPVRWTQSVKNMLADGADSFMEIGPGTVLQGLVKRISGEAEIQIEGLSSLD